MKKKHDQIWLFLQKDSLLMLVFRSSACLFVLSLLVMPLSGFAQSSYYFNSDPTPHYPPYNCGDPSTACGSSQTQSFSTNFQSYNLTQVAGVAAAFSPVSVAEVVKVASPQAENPPQLPRTGGGGRASEVKLKTSVFSTPTVTVLFLFSIVFLFYLRFVVTSNRR